MDEQNIPIDINTTKLLDWLVSRRHISKDWQNSVIKVREKINNAVQDMPAHEGIIKLVKGQHINYFHCLKITDILKETEKDTKNIFGRYGSQRMKDWQDIIALYQKDNIYLAEVAQMLIRNVSYEIPGLKKQIQKLEQTQAESEKKIKDYSKTEAAAFKEFMTSCEQLGIKGDNIKAELIALVNELPKVYEETSEKIKIVKAAIDLYKAFNKFLSGQEIDLNLLATLSYLIEHGNTTTYEFIYGEKPLQIENPSEPTVQEEKTEENGNEIDFGDDAGGNIDFGDTGGEIDFGDQIVIERAGDVEQHIEVGSSRGSSQDESFEILNYDDFNPDINLEESGIVVEKAGQDGGIARGSEALSLLDNPKYREQVINDLLELEAFLKMRLFEMSSETDLLAMSHLQDAPAILQMQSLETVTILCDCVNVALNHMTNKRIQYLHNVKHSPKYVDILTATLKQKLSVVERMKANKALLEKKIKETGEEIRKFEPATKVIIEKTKELQKHIQEDISKKYKGRMVNIIGGVNNL